MTTISSTPLGRRSLLKMGSALAAAAAFGSAARADDAAKPAAGLPSLKGKTIAISVAGTDHFFDLKAYQAQVETVKELGGTPIGLDAGRNDKTLVSQLQTLVTQKPDAVIQTLGTLSVVDPWLKKLRQAGIPVVPAMVVTTPAGVTLRIVLLPVSATYTLPELSTARPPGWLKPAALPVPSVDPNVPPASVVTTPAGVILRMLWLSESAT